MSTQAASGTRLRRTRAFERELDQARAAGCQVIVTGAGVNDLLVDPQNRALSLPDALRSYATPRGLGLVTYSVGTRPLVVETVTTGPKLQLPRCDPDAHASDVVSALIEALRSHATPGLLLFDYTDLVLDVALPYLDNALAVLVRQLQGLVEDSVGWQRAGLTLVMVDRGGGTLERLAAQPGVRTLRLGAPDAEEATIFLQRKASATKTTPLHLGAGLTPQRAARLAGGLMLRDLAELSATSSAARPVTPRSLTLLKGRAIRQQSGGTLELLEDSVTFDGDVAGMPALRLLLQRDQLVRRNTVRLMLAGPPGTGKTYSAQAVAAFLGVPLVSFGRVLGELLGQAENNMRRALDVIRAMAPCVLFVDEADQGALGQRNAGGQTGNEAYGALRAMLFEFLSDPGEDSGISVIGTTNVPGRLDPAASSRFRFLPVLFASGPELAQVMAIHARRERIPLAGDLTAALTTYLGAGRAIDGRSAQRLLADAWVYARESRAEAVDESHLRLALNQSLGHDFTPGAEYSTLTSLVACKNSDSLPWNAARILGEHYPMPAYLADYLSGSEFDVDRVRARIDELERSGVYR